MIAFAQTRKPFHLPLSRRGLGASCPAGDIANPDWLTPGTGLCYSLAQLNQMFPNVGSSYLESYTNMNGVTAANLGYFSRLQASATGDTSVNTQDGSNDSLVGAVIAQAAAGAPASTVAQTVSQTASEAQSAATALTQQAASPANYTPPVSPVSIAASPTNYTPAASAETAPVATTPSTSWFSSSSAIGGYAIPNLWLAVGGVALVVYLIKRRKQ